MKRGLGHAQDAKATAIASFGKVSVPEWDEVRMLGERAHDFGM
jgi:hypothetical protein